MPLSKNVSAKPNWVPDPAFFEEVLDDNVILVSEDGHPFFAKPRVVSAHQPGAGPKFIRVEMCNMQIVEHGTAAVVTCRGTYEGHNFSISLTLCACG